MYNENNILGEQTQAFLFSSLAIFSSLFHKHRFLLGKLFIIKNKIWTTFHRLWRIASQYFGKYINAKFNGLL
jgi:hypothetical protein